MTPEAREASRAYAREYRQRNRERINQLQREWRRKNPDKVREQRERHWERKAKLRAEGGNHSGEKGAETENDARSKKSPSRGVLQKVALEQSG